MSHLLYLIFRCDFDMMENLKSSEKFGDLNTPRKESKPTADLLDREKAEGARAQTQ